MLDKNMILFALVTCMVVIGFGKPIKADYWPDGVTFSIEESTDSTLVIKLVVDTSELEDYCGQPYSAGFSRHFIITDTSNYDYTVVDSHLICYDVSIDGNDTTYDYNNCTNSCTITMFSLRDPYILRDYTGGCFDADLFQTCGSTTDYTVYIIDTLEVKITFGDASSITPPDTVVKEFDGLYQAKFINYSTFRASNPVFIPGEMLIISYGSFINSMSSFIDWKKQKGFKTTLMDVQDIGNDTISIKDTIQWFYDNTDLAWVLLVGDEEHVCSFRDVYGSTPDNRFVFLGGDDYYPDAFIGRFSGQNVSDIQTQVQRTFDYEKNPQGTDWFHKGLSGGENSSICGRYNNEVNNMLMSSTYTHVDNLFCDGFWNCGGPLDSMSICLNEGRSALIVGTHGSVKEWEIPPFGREEVQNLENNNMLPFVFSRACDVGTLKYPTECLGETFLRSTDDSGRAIGAVAAFMSSGRMSANERTFARMMTFETMNSFGALCHSTAGSSGYLYMILFGEPSVSVWTDTPDSMTVTADSLNACSGTELDITVSSVDGALCAVTADTTIYGTGYTNSSGEATVYFTQSLPTDEKIILTVTAFNKYVYIDTLWSDNDGDNDGVSDLCDNCEDDYNPAQTNSDGDSYGDVCDNCPDTTNQDQANSDSDSLGNVCDNCPNITNDDQSDGDSDGIGDSCDVCTDFDGDGYGDGYPEDTCTLDNCWKVANPDQADEDEDGYGDACSGCGDVNNDGLVSILDVTYLQAYLYQQGPAPGVMRSADVNCNCLVNLLDVTYLISYLYYEGPAPICPDYTDWPCTESPCE